MPPDPMLTQELGARVLVTGAGGRLGLALQRSGPPGAIFLTRSELDLTDRDAVHAALRRHRPRAVVNAAAWTRVDDAESHPEAAMACNATAPGHLAEACAAQGAALVHISTDYVFDGTLGRPLTPLDPTSPISAYGRSKELGERAVRSALHRHIILRTAWLVGPDHPDFIATMVRRALSGLPIRVVDDQHGSLTPVDDLARAILAVLTQLDQDPWGTWHVVGTPWTSWYGVAIEIVKLLGDPVPVSPIPSSAWPTPAPRPLDSRLDPQWFEERFGVHIHWRAALPGLVDAWAQRIRHELAHGQTDQA